MEKCDLQRFRDECVAAHNFYRAAHGTPPLSWSTRLAEGAQAWAQNLANTSGSLRYSSAKDVGENLISLWGSELNGQKITRIWYEEGKYFDHERPRLNSRTRSFCQVLWEGTREFGAGAAVTKHGKQIVVARYFPPMNKKDVARNVKKARRSRDTEKPLAFDTRWSSLYVGLKEFHEQCLSVHNEYRIRHGAAPLHWSAELAWEAQQWAENLARIGELRHNDDDTVGENLAGMVGGELSGREAVDIWYEEIESYDFEGPGYSEDTSNFTQVVWVASENLGVGRAIDGELCVVVAFYEPPGNMERYFGDNVLRMGSTMRQRKSKEKKGFIPPPPDLEGFRLECLVTHNYFRARHGAPPLVLSSALTDEAQYWAERLLVTGASEGLDNSRIGISVAVLENKHISGIKVSELWYKQISSYDFNSPGFSRETLDFSQLVWLNTRKLGVGKATGAEGVTVVVARYEPVGNIDGLFVQNVKRRGHERGSSEPMIFHVEYKHRTRADSKSSNSFLSWEHEEEPTLESDAIITKSSYQVPQRNGLNRAKFLLNRLLEDLDRCRNSCSLSPPLSTAASLSWSDFDQFDVNKNMVHKTEEQEATATLTVTDAFTRLVWIDPNSPTLQRKGVTEEAIQGDVDDDEEDEGDEEGNGEMTAGGEEDYEGREEQDDEYEVAVEQEEEDARTAYEEDNRDETEEDPSMYKEEAELEEADLFSDPEDDVYERVCDVRRSLSLDSEGTEPEMQKGNVLSKIAFFETIQRSFETQSLSNSESSLRRSLIQDELEELASCPRMLASHEEHEEAQTEHEEEPECQLEFDDIFPAHREEDDVEVHVDKNVHEEACEDDGSLASLSETEDVLDFTDYDDSNVGIQNYEFENNYCVTHEFTEDPSTLEIFHFSDEDASHQYADMTTHPRQSTKSVFAIKFQESKSLKISQEEPSHLMEDAPENYSEELFQNSEASFEAPETHSAKSLDADLCLVATKQDDVDVRMRELMSRTGILQTEEKIEDSNELLDFNDTKEGKLLKGIVNRRKEYEVPDKQTPIDETCEALVKDNVESEMDLDALFAIFESDGKEYEGYNPKPQTVMEKESSQSPDTLCEVITRDHNRERLSSALEGQTSDQWSASEMEKREEELDISRPYECPLLLCKVGIEPVAGNTEAVGRNDKPERTVDFQANIDGLVRKDTIEGPVEEEYCEAVLPHHDTERTRIFEEICLVPVLPDTTYSFDKPVEPLPYHPASKSTVRELREVTEIIGAEDRQDIRCEINFEELSRSIDEVKDDRLASHRFYIVQDKTDTAIQEEVCEAVLRDYDRECAEDFHKGSLETELIPVSSEVTGPIHEPVEPLPYDQAPVSEDQLPEVTEVISAAVRKHLRSEINFEETLSHLEERTAEYVDEMPERQRFEGTLTAAVENTIVDDVQHCSPSTSVHISRETENDIPTEEIVEVNQEAEPKRPALLYKEEETFVLDVTAEIPSAPKHVAWEGTNLEMMEVVSEVKGSKEEKQASLIVDECELVTEVPCESLSLQNTAGEVEQVAPFQQCETVMGYFNRAPLYMEEDPVVQKVVPDVLPSLSHITSECENIILDETELLEQTDEQTASFYMEENTIVDSVAIKETSLYPLYISGETLKVDPKSQREVEEQPEDGRCPLTHSEEVISLAKIQCDTPLSPKHIACEFMNDSFEKVDGEELTEQKNRVSINWDDEVQVDEVVYGIPASPKHVPGESLKTEFIEEVREIEEDEKEAPFFMEEETIVMHVTTGTAAAVHTAGEKTNKETVKEISEGEPCELGKRASVFLEEDSVIQEVIPGTLFSPERIARESQSVDTWEEMYEECIEEKKRASLFLEEAVALGEVVTNTPSSPKHFAGEITNSEIFEETDIQTEYENKRASIFAEENISHGSVSLEDSNRNNHVAAEISNFGLLDVTGDEESPESDYGEHFEEFEGTCNTGTFEEPPETINIAGEIQINYIHGKAAEDILQLEENINYEDHQQILVTSILVEKPKPSFHIAEEFSNVMPREESSEEKMEEAAFAEEIEETQFNTSTVLLKSPQSLLSIAAAILEQNIDAVQQETQEEFMAKTDVAQLHRKGELADVKLVVSEDLPSNSSKTHEIGCLMQQDETVETTVRSEEEVPSNKDALFEKELELEQSPVLYDKSEVADDMATDDTNEEVEVSTFICLEEPAVLEQEVEHVEKQEIDEVVQTNQDTPNKLTVLYEADVTDDEVTDNTKVPVILVDLASKMSDEEDDNVVYVDEQHEEIDAKKEKEYEEEMNTTYPSEERPTEEQPVQSYGTTEFCVSEVVLEDDMRDREEFVEPFEESEEGSVSELFSECSSSPLHVSSELKDIHDYESVNEEYGIETYHAITYEEGDFVSEMSITKALPSLFITEELAQQDIYRGSTINEASIVTEAAQEYSEAEDTNQPCHLNTTDTSVVISQSPLQTTPELSDSNYIDRVEEKVGQDERKCAEEFMNVKGIDGKMKGKQYDVFSPPSQLVTSIDPQTAEDETDNAQTFRVQDVFLIPAEKEEVVHKDNILEGVWEVEFAKGSQPVETFQEKHKNGQIQGSVETKNRFEDLESERSHSVSQTQKGESLVVGEQGTQMGVSHNMETTVEVLSTTTIHHSSFTTFTPAEEVTTGENQCHLKTNGPCISREEVNNIQEVSFAAIQQISKQRMWTKGETGRPMETNDKLSERILERETKDQELRKFEQELSTEETEVRLMKSEVLECKAVEQQAQLGNPRVIVERETSLVRAFVVQSGASKETEQTLMREDSISAILKDDEESLEEGSVGEQFQEEIDIMRVDEALSEEEFRGEGADQLDRLQSQFSKEDSVEEIDTGKEYESKLRGSDQQNGLHGISEEHPFYEEECEVKQVEEALHQSDHDVIEGVACEEEVEVTAFGTSNVLITEQLTSSEEIKLRKQSSPVFEEELEISALPAEDSPYNEDLQKRRKKVDPLTMFEEEVEVSTFTKQKEPAILKEELDVEHVEKKKLEEVSRNQDIFFQEDLEISTVPYEEEAVKMKGTEEDGITELAVVSEGQQHTDAEEHDLEIAENEEHKGADRVKTEDKTDEESVNHLEISQSSAQKEPLDLSQVDLYDEDESALGTRYYVELSSTESLEPPYEEVEDETCYTETYVRQGDPLEENLEEFILVRYGDEFESSGEEDISDHREIYVIPEEENDVENHDVEAARDGKVDLKDPKPESFFVEGFENTSLEEIRESPEFDIDDSDELDEEEQRQLEEYERLESFVILEEKLSQVESDDDEIADFEVEIGDENVFHSDVHSSSEETLHEEELAQTMIASSIRQASTSTEPEYKQEETSHGNDSLQTQDQTGTEQEKRHVELSPSREDDPGYAEGFTEEKVANDSLVEVAERNSPPKKEGNDSLPEDPTDRIEYSELSRTKEEKTDQLLSSDSSGEQSVSSEGSLSSTPSVDLEGLDSFEQDCLLQHNLYRRQHRVKPLKWSEELAEGAKRWAEHLASVNALESFQGKDVGENLASVEGKELSALEAVDMWYKEIADYNFEDPAFNAKCGRFTQVVWASSREFGVAKILANDGTQYIVARYKPAGNVLGEFKENVKPPRDPSSRLKRRRLSGRRRSRSGIPSTPAEKEKIKAECIISHNYYRAFHNAPALRWSPLLAAEAQNYAERLAKTDSLTHSGQKDRGENLAYTWDSPLSARAAIDMWYDEVQDYDFESPGFTSDTGHFTQLVWVGTEEFGMGMAVAPDGRNIVVGRYFPPGNIVGQFKENVRPREIEGIP